LLVPLQALYSVDPQLGEHRDHLEYRWNQYQTVKANIEKAHGSLEEFAKVCVPRRCRRGWAGRKTCLFLMGVG